MNVSISLPRCGRISYTNDLPVYAAFDDGALAFPGTLMADVPTALNRALLAGELDISPVSSALYPEHADELLLLPHVCVGAPGAVRSIFCFSAHEPRELRGYPVAVTRESLSARTLLRVICKASYGFEPKLVESDNPLAAYLADGSPCLLIGDAAVDAAETVPPANVYDLGELWYALSGVGMVFAVWAVRADYARTAPDATLAVVESLRESLSWGLENIGLIIRRAQMVHPHREGFYADYYRALDFTFGDDAQAALSTFFAEGHKAGIFPVAPPLRFFEPAVQHA
jgi:chorismate dehydratase